MDVDVLIARSCQQVRELLATSRVELVITGVTLADGNWSDIIRHLVGDPRPVNVIVTAERPTDSLWAEVFWRGAYDLLIEPCQADEVRHVVANALRAAKSLAEEKSQSAPPKVTPGREVGHLQPIADLVVAS
jgi:DNA-binding NtrC family response regulator